MSSLSFVAMAVQLNLFMTINIFNTGNVYFKSILRSNMFTIVEQNNSIKLQPMSVAKYWILQSDETKC